MPEAPLAREAFIRRHLPFNLAAFIVDASGWWLGMSFLSSQTILPFFVKRLGGGDLLIGLIPALFSLGYLLPQLFVAPLTERRPIQKYSVLKLAAAERLPFALLALFTFLLAGPAPGLLLLLFFVCISVNAFSMGANMPGYSTMLTKAIPADKRGRLWGASVSVGGIIGLIGAALSAWLLRRYGMPDGFALCFLVGFVVMAVSVVPLVLVREPEALEAPEPPRFRAYWAETWGLLGRFPGFQRLIIAEWLVSIASMAPAFYTVYAMNRFDAGPWAVGRFNMTLIAASVVGGFAWGALSDRFGNRFTLAYSSGFLIAAPLLALLLPSLAWFPAVFFLSTLASSGFDLGNFNIILEYSGEKKVATFQGMRALLVTPARVLFPVLGGLLVKEIGFNALFILAAVAGAGAIYLYRSVPDPRHEPVGHSHEEARSPRTLGAEG